MAKFIAKVVRVKRVVDEARVLFDADPDDPDVNLRDAADTAWEKQSETLTYQEVEATVENVEIGQPVICGLGAGAVEQIVVESDDFGGLRFAGTKAQLLRTAQDMREAVQDAGSMPNYLSDFIFGLEVRCQELGLMGEDFEALGEG